MLALRGRRALADKDPRRFKRGANPLQLGSALACNGFRPPEDLVFLLGPANVAREIRGRVAEGVEDTAPVAQPPGDAPTERSTRMQHRDLRAPMRRVAQ